MRGFARILPWVLVVGFAVSTGFLLSRLTTSVREARRVDAAPVVAAMRKIAQLATVEAEISDVLRFEEVKSFLIFDFPKTATLRMRGKVIAGFDLTSTDFQLRADTEQRLLKVALPAPRLLAIDPRLEWFDENSGIFNPITPQDRTRWMLWARGQLARAAKDSGIEARAVEHARELLAGTASALGWRLEMTDAKSGDAREPVATP